MALRRFRNPNPHLRGPGVWKQARYLLLDRWWGAGRRAPAGNPAPHSPLDHALLADDHAPPHITWLGHAAALLRLGGRNLLIDPCFSQRVAWIFHRHAPAAATIEQLPRIDLLLISHNHWDHFDPPTLDRLDRSCTVIVPRRLGRWFCRRGFSRVIELDWWERVELDGVRVDAVPAQHGSGRCWVDTDRTLWCGFVMSADRVSVYHAGDTAWYDGFGEIARRFPQLTAALLPIAGYEPQWLAGHAHMTPEEAVRAFQRLQARWLIPIHWGTFQFSSESLQEPIERLQTYWQTQADLATDRLVPLAIGETWPLGPSQIRVPSLPER